MIKKEKVLITGGTGFIGSNLALNLIENGYEVIITGNESEQDILDLGVKKCLYPSSFGIDFSELEDIDILFHQAALNDTRITDRREMLLSNFESSKILFRYVANHGCKRIIYASSTAVYGRNSPPYKESGPFDLNTPYAESKLLLDDYAQNFSKDYPDTIVVGLRYCNVYGPRENHKGKRASMIYQLAQQMQKGRPKLFKYGKQRRDYIYIKDVVEANILAMSASESCIINCGFGKSISFNEIVEILNEVFNLHRETVYINNPYEGNYQDYTECDMTLAKEKLNFIPKYTIEDGIKDYLKSGFLVK